MLEQLSVEPYSIAISEGGLFLTMCEEFQLAAGPAQVYVACGRDAAERILAWDYGDPETLDRMFGSFQLLVAARQGEFQPPGRFGKRIHTLGIAAVHDAVSSTAVRQNLETGLPWRHLVPDPVASLVEQFYRSSAADGDRKA